MLFLLLLSIAAAQGMPADETWLVDKPCSKTLVPPATLQSFVDTLMLGDVACVPGDTYVENVLAARSVTIRNNLFSRGLTSGGCKPVAIMGGEDIVIMGNLYP